MSGAYSWMSSHSFAIQTPLRGNYRENDATWQLSDADKDHEYAQLQHIIPSVSVWGLSSEVRFVNLNELCNLIARRAIVEYWKINLLVILFSRMDRNETGYKDIKMLP